MTATAVEYRLLLPRDEVADLVALLDASLRRYSYWGEPDKRLPNPRQYATTIYFDTETHVMYRRALASPQAHAKLRAREHYDHHPDLIETATDPAQLYHHPRALSLELKDGTGKHLTKARVRVRKGQVENFLRNHLGHGAKDLDTMVQARRSAPPEDESAARLSRFLASHPLPFLVTCLVNYRRTAWQCDRTALRVTLDSELAVFRRVPELLENEQSLVRARLGAPAFVEAGVIAEFSVPGAPPSWLSRFLQSHESITMHGGKFLLASQQLYPDLEVL